LASHFAAALGEPDVHPAGAWLWRQPEAPWQRALRAIESYVKPASERKVASKYSRIRVNLMPHYAGTHLLEIEVRELRPTAKGWTGGRQLDSARLAEEALTRVDPDDLRTLELLTQWRRRVVQRFEELDLSSPVVDALIDYPHVVTGVEGDRPLRVIRHTPRLLIRRDRDGRAHVQLDPSPDFESRRSAEWTRDALVLTHFDADTLKLANALGGEATFPEVALPALLALAPQLSRRIEVDTDFGLTAIAADVDARIHVLIEPLKEGLRLRLRTRPLGTDGIYFVPAVGGTEILGLRDGAPVRARRVLADEQRELDHLLREAPLLAGGEHGDDVDIPAAEMALEALSQLIELGERVLLDWSQHKRWSLTRRQGMGQLSLKVRAQRDWFHAEGGLKLDDGQVVSLASLLEALPSSQGRFVRLADERIVALSQELAKQLRQVRALADTRGRLELSPVAATALQPLIDAGADVDLDEAFQAQLQRIAQATDINPEVPANLDAELRDYQIEGFRWLMRLASWGAGACLADDMGLGKTLQALALLLARAPDGPAIVVAPTSVVANWRSEAQRFAPSLELRVYGDGDRTQMLDELGPGCVLLISYGLLTLNIDAIAELRFATLVMDEAQAIKNAAAQRTLAIRRVQADFRIATTGTPIENHLGELWSLMRVLNPGLLGSQEHFAKRFIAPIERDSRGPERATLRQLISPFLLRRMKSQVLAELPPRTEIVLTIEPSPGEAKLLAAVRRQAIERLETGGLPEEAKRFHVLAEITRLRRAACHPSLVAPELNLTGAKLEQLLELVAELKENRHRALVFSQFVDYLHIVRAAFDQAGISYQYLDGSTSPKAREAAVNAFQGGSGDVFLLSLKAGGVGLNLTAADYVIHLDPWWNPAVEQQATDRAHRIGQTRPVTVYKLVVKGSIEEQILALHGSKREIADSVLADQDTATKMNVGELIGLLQMG
jgi:superfamily II DNA or RNA helicase